MTGNGQYVALAKGTSQLGRPRFGAGMLLQSDDLEQLNVYTRDLSRLLFRSLLGCGVVCGLVVRTEVKCGKVWLMVGAGVGLDCAGDPVWVPQDQRFVFDDTCSIPPLKGPLWVILCHTAKCCAPRAVSCSPDDDATPVCTREMEGFEIRVVRARPKCVCGCPEPPHGRLHESCEPPPLKGELVRPRETEAEERRAVYEEREPHEYREHDCRCADPKDPCYADHYKGKCGCACADCCDCGCILLAELTRSSGDDQQPVWTPDHRVRRFIRPVLMRDPQVECEAEARKEAKQHQASDGGDGTSVENEPAGELTSG
jgi:hypothetical protein